jgi:hypothetical protein
MAENKKSFVLYSDQRSMIDMLSDEHAGQLLKHIYSYVNDENPINDNILINLAFEPIKQQLKRDLVKWESTKEGRSKAGKASAEKRKLQQEATNSTNVKSVQQEATNSTVNDNVNVNVNVINNNIEERKLKFANYLKPYLDSYGKDVLNNFFAYWSEHGPNDKKMRYEKEKSFNTHLRLIRWVQNDKTFKPKKEVLFTTPEGIEITDKTVLHTYKQTGLV